MGIEIVFWCYMSTQSFEIKAIRRQCPYIPYTLNVKRHGAKESGGKAESEERARKWASLKLPSPPKTLLAILQ